MVKADGEGTALTLVVPALDPGAGAQRPVGMEELAAGSEVLTLGENALVVVDVVLPTVLGLVLVREAGVEAGSHELEGLGLAVVGVRHGGDVELEKLRGVGG